MRDIPEKDQIPQTRDGLLIYIKALKSHINSHNKLLEIAEERLEVMEVELGLRKAVPDYGFN